MPAKTLSRPTPQRLRARQEYAKLPTKTKADDPGRYTKTPHEYGDVLISGGKLGGPLERDLLYWIERHTWGANTSRKPNTVIRPEFAKLSLTQFAKLCQSWDSEKGKLRPVERKNVAIALARLQRDGIIEARDRSGCGRTTAKMYKLTPERWKDAPPYRPPTPKQTAEAEAEAELATEEETVDELEATTGDESTVESGRKSRPQSVPMSMKKGEPTVTIRVVYNPVGFDFPITFRSRPGLNGRLQIIATPGQHANCSRPQPQRFAQSSPVNSPVSVDPKQVTEYTAWVSEFLLNFWGKTADRTLISSIITAADGAPVATFERIVLNRFRRNRTGRGHSPGLLIDLARDAYRTHVADKARAAATEPAAVEAQPSDECSECHLTLAYTAGPGKGKNGRVCQTPGCDLEGITVI